MRRPLTVLLLLSLLALVNVADAEGQTNLVLRTISWSPDPATFDEQVSLSTTVGNEGTEGGQGLQVTYYLSSDSDLNTTSDNYFLGSQTFDIALADVTLPFTFSPQGVSGLSPGLYFVLVLFVDESEFWRDTDNTLEISNFANPPDIALSTGSISGQVEVGGSVTDRFDIRNDGLSDLHWTLSISESTGQSLGKRMEVEEIQSPQSDVYDPTFNSLLFATNDSGYVRILIEIRSSFDPEGHLSLGKRAEQRREIGRLQQELLNDMPPGSIRSVARFRSVPLIALDATAEAVMDLADHPAVLRIHRDRVVPPTLPESTQIVSADVAWQLGTTGAGQTIVILDTGVDRSHPFLSGKVVDEACFSSTTSVSQTLCPSGTDAQTGSGSGIPCGFSGCSHGTHVAGIAAGSGPDFSGVARDASVMAIQVFSRFNDPDDCNQSAPCVQSWSSDQALALEYAMDRRMDFNIAAVNMSLGGGSSTGACDGDFLKPFIDNLRSVGIATIIASGNGGLTDSLAKPSCISTAISVGSTNKTDVVSTFSNSSTDLDLLAPGGGIKSSVPGGGYQISSGTSMAAPHVAGAWALMRSSDPAAAIETILTALKNTGEPIVDSRNGITKPRIQVNAALTAIATMWLSTVPRTGTLAPGGSETVVVTMNAETLSPGTYTGELSISSNDPDESPIAISVTLVVEESVPVEHVLTIASVNPDSGVPVSFAPVSIVGASSGTTPFTARFTENTTVTLTAPETAQNNGFAGWRCGSGTGGQTASQTVVTVVMNAALTCTASYETVSPIEVSLPSQTGDPGATVILPIMVGAEIQNANVTSFSFTLAFDSLIVRLSDIRTAGTLSASMTCTFDAQVVSRLAVTCSGGTPISSAGTLLEIQADLVSSGRSPVAWQTASFNSGNVLANTADGLITVAECLLGDVDSNGQIQAHDASQTLKYTLQIPVQNIRLCAMDVDGNGTIDQGDATLILQRTVGTIACFSADASCTTTL